jgi:plasmid stabilization system protein ParE
VGSTPALTVTFKVQLSPQARTQIAAINVWWAENRRNAPTLVAIEFEAAIEQLSASPQSGRTHARSNLVHTRKMLMPRSSYHLYYDVDAASRVVTILAVWHAARGQGPAL